jgi:elongation factor P--(R)-beta-lysine ligase
MAAGDPEHRPDSAEALGLRQADFLAGVSAARLEERARLLCRVREYFAREGFLEVETPLLSHDVVVDRHLDPLEVLLPAEPTVPDAGTRMWLQTSPEFGMKRLLASARRSIYQITRAFRAGEQGRLHNPEFTMVEWYELGADYAAGIARLADLAHHLLGRRIGETLTYREAFQRHLDLDPHRATAEQLRQVADRCGSAPEWLAREDRDTLLDWLLAEYIQPHLGHPDPLILCDYPATQAALARLRMDGGTEVAERFELYVDGIELANGYHELLDADVLLARNRSQNTARQRDGKRPLPESSRLLAAMRAGLPPSSGVALGFDRLLMIACGATSLAEILPFPIEGVGGAVVSGQWSVVSGQWSVVSCQLLAVSSRRVTG